MICNEYIYTQSCTYLLQRHVPPPGPARRVILLLSQHFSELGDVSDLVFVRCLMTLPGPPKLSLWETLACLLHTHLLWMIYLTIPMITMRNADIRYSTFHTGALRMDLVRYCKIIYCISCKNMSLLSFDHYYASNL